MTPPNPVQRRKRHACDNCCADEGGTFRDPIPPRDPREAFDRPVISRWVYALVVLALFVACVRWLA